MSKLTWNDVGEHIYEAGVDNGVLYLLKYGRYSNGVAWNGLTAVTESPSGAEATALYADNIKYLNLMSNEEFGATVEAYTYPDEFRDCLGENEVAKGVIFGQQKREHFGLCYRTKVGNDIQNSNFGYKLHLVFNCLAAPTEKNYITVNDSPEALTHSWKISTVPIDIPDFKSTATLVLDSRKFTETGIFNVLRRLEEILFGTETTEARLPTISEIIATYELQMYLRDSNNDALMDSSGKRIQSRVFD